ncbi:nucleic acid-binding protein [Hesseltinella vesiculosa]|uniref:CST complex subunit STN1 n=1 Tax=Hesseltinella vesiculosa TaxID=101127 RepID=A0A1X2GKV1_9FUNG|nr:nucleic acid-binding protein [Hesseltinella vesiculosa]
MNCPDLFGIDGLFHTPVTVFIKDVIRHMNPMPDHPDVYQFLGHIIRQCDIHGIIVAVDQTHSVITYTVDDGTGMIICCRWKNSMNSEKAFTLGTSVRVVGRVSHFRSKKQIVIDSIGESWDPNEEVTHMLQAMVWKKRLYRHDFVVPDIITENLEYIKKDLEQTRSDVDAIGPGEKPELEDTKEGYQQAILQYVSNTYGQQQFTSTDLLVATELEEIAQRVLAKDLDGTRNGQIQSLLVESLNTLCNSGDIVSSKNDYGAYCYQLMDQVRMEKEVLSIIQDTVNNESSLVYGGVPSHYIQAMVIQRGFVVNEKRFKGCLEKMVRDGTLYLSSKFEYKIPD